MENASKLRAILNRLRFLGRPLPLAGTVGALLLGVFIWDYLRHPEWFGAYENTEAGPNEELNLSGLTPDEQVAVSGIDNLTLLFNELGIESNAMPEVQALADPDAEGENTFLSETLALSQPNPASENLSNSPFTRYLEKYQFGGRLSTANTTPGSLGNSLGGTNFFQVNNNSSGSDRSAEEIRRLSPLAAALLNPTGRVNFDRPEEGNPLANELRSQFASTAETENGANGETAASSLPPGQFGSQTVTIPGIEYPVLPTLPQMSPPPGTTGYTPPASLELMPPLPGSNRANSPAFPGATAPAPGSTGVPSLTSSPGASLNSPQVDVSNGYVTPFTPVTPTVTPTPVTPAPFTAPRPIGGGYINTFSNPSGPSN